jgi:hypothetical protein
MPIEAPAQTGNGTGKGSPFYDKEPTELPRIPLGNFAPIKGMGEALAPRSGSDDLVEAANKVCKALLKQIAYHDAEAQKLRAALVPFAAASRQNGAPAAKPSDGDQLLQSILKFADNLPTAEESTSD